MSINKRLFIVGNTINILGVEADIRNYCSFFTSDFGGAWTDDEINIQTNLTEEEFLKWINFYKALKLDYFIFVFCGHGGTTDGCLEMQLSNPSQRAKESIVANVSTRQLNIYDCCRGVDDEDDLEPLTESRTISFSDTSIGNVRRRYEARIMQSIPQCSSLYACSVGEYSRGSSKGGFFSQYLLQAARKMNGIEYKTIGRCHSEASKKMEILHPEQTPDYVLPRCFVNQSLILSIHP